VRHNGGAGRGRHNGKEFGDGVITSTVTAGRRGPKISSVMSALPSLPGPRGGAAESSQPRAKTRLQHTFSSEGLSEVVGSNPISLRQIVGSKPG
jgi:hypothetical protein